MKDLFDITKFGTKKELFSFLVENKTRLIAQKKATIKHADGVSMLSGYANGTSFGITRKAESSNNDLQVKAVINTTNLIDSHNDVHLPGLWNKSLIENKMIMHLQEHQMTFDKIIADLGDIKATVKTYTWKELGFNFDGSTQALIFDSTVKSDRNSFMFTQYMNGRVKNHSVGMRYVKLVLAINDEEYDAEFEAWNKYYPKIANKEFANDTGYFWAVKEAKIIEGSAVPIGSNYATPTLETKKPPGGTSKTIEPPKQLGTHEINYLIN